ncbi:Trimeric GatFAB AmidoTransferase(AdT) complex subunit [Apophysomyces ossiformis]|uniref:Glutamyl-tRNA(Gln) amidotransferase subunit A, mitochondrial n=1 Tax=Apophysomyces ossiformis TaxID=679940 RepID=A0A8H7BUI4_9FUNG|nr:Trimeric GatFAB AmidoTransferase(AdT) complex subunit [Apophysomyces ossiformis]
MDEFGMGSANIYSDHGPVNNPYTYRHDYQALDDPAQRRAAGGSSGGSAAAVAMNMCLAALGSDTGGSVRLPASYCGVVGFKPSYGRCSRRGLIAYANSLDTVGILAKSAKDVLTVYGVIAQHDPDDPTSMPTSLRNSADELDQELASRWNSDDLTGLVVGIPQEYYVEPLSSDVKDVWRDGIRQLKKLGASIVPISLPHTRYALSAYYTVALAEASSNLARYDGVRFGHRSTAMPSDDLIYADTRAEGFGSEVQRRILLGTHVLTAGAYETLFLPAQRARRLIQSDFDETFLSPNPLNAKKTDTKGNVHLILTPSAISSAPNIDDCIPTADDNTRVANAYLNDVMTVPASLSGIPAVSIPFGKSRENGYPIGLQLLGPYGHDRFLLRIADVLARNSS